MPNYVWYLCLGIISIIIDVFTVIKTKKIKLISLLFGMIGVGYSVEFFICKLFDSYRYIPDILDNSYDDNILGAIASNAFSLPSASIVIAGFYLNMGWIVLFSGLFFGIECLFLKLGIYEHNWWKSIYTFVALTFYFGFAKIWFRKMETILHPSLYFATLCFIIFSIRVSMDYVLYAIIKSHLFLIGWFEDPSRDNTVFSHVQCFLISILIVILFTLKLRLSVKIVLVFLISGLDSLILVSLGILHMKSWDVFFTFSANLIAFLILFPFSWSLLSFRGHLGYRQQNAENEN